jgi:hypothetical protein
VKREKGGQDVEDHPISFPFYDTVGKWLERDYIGGGIVVRCLEDQVLETRIAIEIIGLPVFWIPVHDLEEVLVEVVGGHVVVDE